MKTCCLCTRARRRGPVVRLAALFYSALLLGMSAHAALYVEVDKASKTYYVSGSASGTPAHDEMNDYVSFDNGQAYGGVYTNLFSQDMFKVSGNTMAFITFFLHASGNINGGWNLASASYCTITGDTTVRASYAGFEATLIAELESKADAVETIPVTEGSSTFAMTIRNAPIGTCTVSEFSNGSIAWTNVSTSLYYTVEWCPNLDTNAWTGDYTGLQNVRSTQGVIRVPVPMFFRVVGSSAPR